MRLCWMMILSLGVAGCAGTATYNPMEVASQQELLLNQSGFKTIQDGMTQDEVHKIMGTELVIGYQYQAPDYKPLTIPNPYKTENGKDEGYVIEYYIQSIQQPDGIIHDNELMPLVFKDGKLSGRGWSAANTERPAHSAS